jgi:hypothetical protein
MMITRVKAFSVFHALCITLAASVFNNGCGFDYYDTPKQPVDNSASTKQPSYSFPHAVEYSEYSAIDYTSDPRRKRTELIIVSNALTIDERAHTVMKAAFEHQQRTGCTVATAIIGVSAFLADKGRQFTYAIADYAADGEGYAGKQGWTWDVKVSSQVFEENELKAASLYYKYRDEFKIPDGLGFRVDEEGLKKYIANKHSIPIDDIDWPYIKLETYDYSSSN